MSRPPAVSCQGAPRDLGHDQGAFARHAIATARRKLPRPSFPGRLLPDPQAPEVRLGRDMRRYFPHLFERTIGMARGAGVSERVLWSFLARHADVESGATIAAVGEPTCMVRAIAHSPADLIVRRSEPGESDFRSIEVALPGIVPALVGVNEHGLAVSASWGSAVRDLEGRRTSAAPALLLAQDCLQRFDAVEAALEWCSRRPAAGPATLVLADAAGACAGVYVLGDERQVFHPKDGLLIAPFGGERARRIEKAASAQPQRDMASLHKILDESNEPSLTRVTIEAGTPRLGLSSANGDTEWLTLNKSTGGDGVYN
ncbi:MAG: hypothetical protein JRG95_20060 [Deltaproteobacteria bacterium]|nr:hypothetical protein [Deltaproteobacteria bacterium]